jgi:tetratricopeptide (TPR) repeat protein
MDAPQMTAQQLANFLVLTAYTAQQHGQLDRASQLYRASLRIAPSAEAWTGLGHVYGLRGDLPKAIALCRKAIGLDPDFGNAYSAIGTYLVELQRFPEAIPWLRRALHARRYYGFGALFYLIGRMHECLGEELKALRSYAQTLIECPDCPEARAALERLIIRRN